MSYETYKLIHFFSIISLFLSLGALLVCSGNKKKIMTLHGLALLVLLVSGFGLMARLKMFTFPFWVILKLCIWFILGVLIPVMISRKVNKKWSWLIVFVGGFGAVWLAVLKPFI